jgi:hypothetical protein
VSNSKRAMNLDEDMPSGDEVIGIITKYGVVKDDNGWYLSDDDLVALGDELTEIIKAAFKYRYLVPRPHENNDACVLTGRARDEIAWRLMSAIVACDDECHAASPASTAPAPARSSHQGYGLPLWPPQSNNGLYGAT